MKSLRIDFYMTEEQYDRLSTLRDDLGCFCITELAQTILKPGADLFLEERLSQWEHFYSSFCDIHKNKKPNYCCSSVLDLGETGVKGEKVFVPEDVKGVN